MSSMSVHRWIDKFETDLSQSSLENYKCLHLIKSEIFNGKKSSYFVFGRLKVKNKINIPFSFVGEISECICNERISTFQLKNEYVCCEYKISKPHGVSSIRQEQNSLHVYVAGFLFLKFLM